MCSVCRATWVVSWVIRRLADGTGQTHCDTCGLALSLADKAEYNHGSSVGQRIDISEGDWVGVTHVTPSVMRSVALSSMNTLIRQL